MEDLDRQGIELTEPGWEPKRDVNSWRNYVYISSKVKFEFYYFYFQTIKRLGNKQKLSRYSPVKFTYETTVYIKTINTLFRFTTFFYIENCKSLKSKPLLINDYSINDDSHGNDGQQTKIY